MAEETKKPDTTQEKPITVDDKDKTPKVKVDKETKVAPAEDKPAEKPESTEAPDAEDISDVLILLNLLDKEKGGKGEISEIPNDLRGSIRDLVDIMSFIEGRFEDPLHKAIFDDLYDQEQDGKTPSVEVAIARNIPLAKLQELADSEEYEGTQGALAETIDGNKKAEEEEVVNAANFDESQKAGEDYATEMGYDEAEKNALFQMVLDLFKIMADGKLTKEEFAKVDKMRNYDKDIEGLRSQVSDQGSKEVLPDQASVDAVIQKPQPTAPKAPANAPGMGSMDAYMNPATDVTKIGSRRRGQR